MILESDEDGIGIVDRCNNAADVCQFRHIANFLDCIKTGKRPNADIEEGHKSTLLCHLGNIAHRVNRVLTTSEKDGHIQNDNEATQLWSREYRKGWEPKV